MDDLKMVICTALGDDPHREGPPGTWLHASPYQEAANAVLAQLRSPDAHARVAQAIHVASEGDGLITIRRLPLDFSEKLALTAIAALLKDWIPQPEASISKSEGQ